MVLGVFGLNLSLTCDNIPPVRSIITRPASPSLLACALMASASGCGAFALLGYGAPVATLLHLRWGLAHLRWLATELDARSLLLW